MGPPNTVLALAWLRTTAGRRGEGARTESAKETAATAGRTVQVGAVGGTAVAQVPGSLLAIGRRVIQSFRRHLVYLLVISHTKYTKRRLNGSTAHGQASGINLALLGQSA